MEVGLGDGGGGGSLAMDESSTEGKYRWERSIERQILRFPELTTLLHVIVNRDSTNLLVQLLGVNYCEGSKRLSITSSMQRSGG